MSGEKDRYRTLTAAAVLLVAAIAAAVSYVHVASLAIRYGQPLLAAYLLPVSIDGLVATSSLVMLRTARSGGSTPWLARTGLFLAVVATLACNVAYGLPHGWPGALLSGWPAVAFIVAAEMAIGMTRRRPAKAVIKPDSVRPPAPKPGARVSGAKRPAGRTSKPDSESVVRQALAADPAITTGQLAAMTGLSDRTVRRARARLNGTALASD
jgi:hypothetical protein